MQETWYGSIWRFDGLEFHAVEVFERDRRAEVGRDGKREKVAVLCVQDAVARSVVVGPAPAGPVDLQTAFRVDDAVAFPVDAVSFAVGASADEELLKRPAERERLLVDDGAFRLMLFDPAVAKKPMDVDAGTFAAEVRFEREILRDVEREIEPCAAQRDDPGRGLGRRGRGGRERDRLPLRRARRDARAAAA